MAISDLCWQQLSDSFQSAYIRCRYLNPVERYYTKLNENERIYPSTGKVMEDVRVVE